MVCKLRRIRQAAVLLAVWMTHTAMAMQSEEIETSGAEPILVVADEAEVDLALIEFLGQWETDGGQWIAPSDLADDTFVELIETMGGLEIEEID